MDNTHQSCEGFSQPNLGNQSYQNYGTAPQHTSYVPESVPMDLTHLEKDTGSGASSFTDRIPTGSSIADPASIEEYGRTFTAYKEGKYFVPNDAAEQDRLDLQHHMFRLILGDQLALAPLSREPASVLDIGTGTGIWAMEFAEEHPTSFVIGTDLSQIQPVHAAPPNCMFVREDVEDTWTHQTYFDYIHLRAMVTCFDDHKLVAQKIYENLNPGGFVEYQDGYFPWRGIDGSIKGTNVERWIKLATDAGLALGRDFGAPKHYKKILAEVGFVDIVEKHVAVPLGPWPKDPKQKQIGAIACANMLVFVDGFSQNLLSRGSNMPADEIEELTKLLKKDILNRDIRLYGTFIFVYGRKPFPEEVAPSSLDPGPRTE